MTPVKRLLAATDFSAAARHAAERAARVARVTGAALDLVHVTAFSPLDELRRLVSGLPHNLAERMQEQAQMVMDALATSLRDRFGVTAATHLPAGPLLKAIQDTAAATAADLLVLGARGSSMVRHTMLGSTADRLVSSFSRPLLVVKRAATADYACVLVPVDFSHASLPALQLAHALAPQARIVVLHAYEAPLEDKLLVAGLEEEHLRDYRERARREAQQRITALCEQAGLPPEQTASVLAHGPAPLRILEQEEKQDCELIVLGRQGQSRIDDMLLGSVSRRVLAEAEVDVLVLP